MNDSDDCSDRIVEFDALKADPAHDVWSLGCVCYHILSGCSLFFTNNDDNIANDKELSNLYEFTDSFKTERLSIIKDNVQKNFISQMLMKGPIKRPTMARVLQHSYITGHTSTRFVGEAPGSSLNSIFLLYLTNSIGFALFLRL